MRKSLFITVISLLIGWQAISWAQPGSGIGTSYSTYRERAAKPSNPPANYQRLYYKSDHKLYTVNSSGTETEIGAGSGSVATDTIWAAAGDLVYGTANDAAAILTHAGAANYFLGTSSTTAFGWRTAAQVKTSLGYYTSGDTPSFAGGTFSGGSFR